jgi:hypothetical protein
MANDSNRFRLRHDEKIIGYKKQIGKSFFFSKDEYAWSGAGLEYTVEDKFTGFFDNNRRAIYAEDIIEFTKKTNVKFALILYDDILEKFQLIDMSTEDAILYPWYDFLVDNPFVFKSFHFIQRKL